MSKKCSSSDCIFHFPCSFHKRFEVVPVVGFDLPDCLRRRHEEGGHRRHAGFTGDKFSFDGALPIKNADLPEGYTPVPHEKFLAAYKALVDSIGENPTVTTSSTYADIAALFGTEGIQVPNKADSYATYYWISDKEENVNRNVFVSVTFKKNGGNMTYYAYSSTDIMPEDVR